MDKGDYIEAVALNKELIAFNGTITDKAEFITIKADITQSDYPGFRKRLLDDNFFKGKILTENGTVYGGELTINSLEHDSHGEYQGEFLFAKDLKSCIEKGQTIVRNK